MINDDDKPALLSLITRHVRVWEARKADQKIKEEVDKRLAAYPEEFKKLRTAFSLFEIDTTVEGWGEPIQEAVGKAAYNEAARKGGRIVIDDEVPRNEEPENVAPPPIPALAPGAPVRELVLEQLKSAPDGLKASEMRAHIERLRNETLHEKTVGMTLYRLSEGGLVRREGRVWFYVPQGAETKNPGGETPGPINSDD